MHLDPGTNVERDALANAQGKSPELELSGLPHAAHEARTRRGQRAGGEHPGKFLDAASRLGAVACVKGDPTDLATNPDSTQGFGED